jgi:transposase
MVTEAAANYASQWAAIESVSDKIGASAETVRKWVRRAEVDGGQRPGLTSEEAAEIKRLRREVAELRRANEILKAAAAFFGPSSTGHRSSRELHRRAQRPHRRRASLGGRVDLPGPVPAGHPGRSSDVLRGQDPAAVAAGSAWGATEAGHRRGARPELRRLRSTQDAGRAAPREAW